MAPSDMPRDAQDPPDAGLVEATRGWLGGARLTAARSLEWRAGAFIFVADDAALTFELAERLPAGWYSLDLRMVAGVPLRPRVYVEGPKGFSETAVVHLRKGPSTNYSALFRIGAPCRALRLHPSRFPFEAEIGAFRLTRIGPLRLLGAGLRAARSSLKRGPADLLRFVTGAVKTLVRPGFDSFDTVGASARVPFDRADRYRRWVDLDRQRVARRLADTASGHLPLPPDPGFDVLVPLSPGPDLAERAGAVLAGLAGQALAPRRCLLAVESGGAAFEPPGLPAGPVPHDFVAVAADRPVADRILAVAAGPGAPWLLVLPEEARLAPHALLALAEAIAAAPEAAVLYADEDRTEPDGSRHDGLFRPAWSEAHFHARDYLGRTLAIRRAAAAASVGEPGPGRLTRLVLAAGRRPGGVRHLGEILTHRAAPAGPAPETWETPDDRMAAVRDDVGDRGIVEPCGAPGRLRVRWRLPDPPPLVSIVVPTRDRIGLVRTCLSSILEKTLYPAYEILLVDNGSVEPESHAYFREIAADPRVRVLPWPHPFNYSAINNFAVASSAGEVVLLLNNDTEVTAPGWLGEMVGWALRPEIGAVGAKLYYPDGTIQHAGVALLSETGIAGHVHVGEPGDAAGYHDRLAVPQDYSAVTAACLAVRRAVYDEVGGLDADHLAVAFNDVDFCLKLGRAGYRVVWTPHAELVHHESVSRGSDMSPENKARFLREVDHMARTWGPLLGRDPYYSRHFDRTNGHFMPKVE